MEAIIFCGIQASGKTTFYIRRFLKTHVRISLDLFNTRRKEAIFLQTCLQNQQKFAIDNTNPTKKDRQTYIVSSKEFKFKVLCFYFQSTLGEAITRNKNRTGKELIPVAGIGGTYKRLEPPEYEEGFDAIFIVTIANNDFVVKEMGTTF